MKNNQLLIAFLALIVGLVLGWYLAGQNAGSPVTNVPANNAPHAYPPVQPLDEVAPEVTQGNIGKSAGHKIKGMAYGKTKNLRLEDEGSPTVDVSMVTETNISISGIGEVVVVEVDNDYYEKTVEVGNLVSGKTYHVYNDGLVEHRTVVADENGSLSLTLASGYKTLIVQPNPSTVHITGPDGAGCEDVGTFSNGVCTLNQDVNETICVHGSDLILDCDGHSILYADYSPPWSPTQAFGIYISGAQNVTVENCTVDTSSATRSIAVSGSQNVTVRNNTISNSVQFGIHSWFTGGAMTIEGNTLTDFYGQGIFARGSSIVHIIGNTLQSSSFFPANPNAPWYASLIGINTPQIYGGEISGNDITLSAPESENVLLSGISGWLLGNLTIENNDIDLDSGIPRDRRDNVTASQVSLGSAIEFDGASDMVIVNNTITTTGAGGISTASGSGYDNTNLSISGNSISGAVMPVYLLRATGSTVEYNTISASGSVVLAVGSGNTVRNNTIRDGVDWGEAYRCMIGVSEPWGHPEFPNGLFPAECDQTSGIVLMAGETGSTISGNVIRNMPGAGVLIEETHTYEVDDGGGCCATWPFDPDLSHPITMPATENNDILNNVLMRNGAGIKVVNSTDNTFERNDVYNNDGLPLESVNTDGLPVAMDVGSTGIGNWWHGDCGKGLFVPAEDSNDALVVDSNPYKHAIASTPVDVAAPPTVCPNK